MRPFWIWRRLTIPKYEIGARTLTPVVQVVGLRWPGGGFLWQFPLAVEVETEEKDHQAHQRLPIPDPTRVVVWFLYGLTIAVVIVLALTAWQQRQRTMRKSIST